MNWLDFMIIAIVIVGAVMGMRIGLLGAAFNTAGMFIGWGFASYLSDDMGQIVKGIAGDSLSSDTWVTVISYALFVVAGLVVGGLVWKIVRPLVTVFTLGLSGMVDKLGGLALGLIIGLAIAGTLITIGARFTYDFEQIELPEGGIAGSMAGFVPDVAGKIAKIEDTRTTVEEALAESTLAEVFINITDALPLNAFGFVPSDFKGALDLLERKMDEDDS